MNAELKALVGALIDTGKFVQLVIEKKGIDASEIVPAEGLAMELPGALGGLSAAKAQLAAIDKAGEEDLAAFIMTKLALADAKQAAIVAKSFTLLIDGYELAQAIKA